jgi:hypothetical protein
VNGASIKLLGTRDHTKASESYVDVVFTYPNEGRTWQGAIPYNYRRLGLFLEDPVEIAELIDTAYTALERDTAVTWREKEQQVWESEYANKAVTKPFFDQLLNFEWNCVAHQFPPNPNWARRIQDIKELGYLLGTNTNMRCETCQKNTTHLVLVPLERGVQTGYEVISPSLRKRIIKLLKGYNAFEARYQTNTANLIPDHKFPEISWDEATKQANLDDLTDEQIIAKFQLLDNQRNLQKREANRLVFQTGKRDTIFGIKYFYKGGEDWDERIPRYGADAEEGWVGSAWYDIEAWRQELNKDLERLRQMDKQKKYLPRDEDVD